MRKLLSFVLFSLIALVSTAQDKQHYCPQFVVGQYVSYDYAASLNWQHSPYWLFNDVEFMFSLNMFDGELHNNFSLKVLETDADSTTFELDITKIAAPNNFTFEADKQLIEQIQQIFNRIKPIVKVEWKAQQWLLVNQTDLLFGFYDFLKSQVPNKNVSKEEFIEELKNLPTEMVKAVFLSFCPGFDAWLKAYWQPYAVPTFSFKTTKRPITAQVTAENYLQINGTARFDSAKMLCIDADIETAREHYNYSGPIVMKVDSNDVCDENVTDEDDKDIPQNSSAESVVVEDKPALYLIQRHRKLRFAADSWIKDLTDNVRVEPNNSKSTARIVLKRK